MNRTIKQRKASGECKGRKCDSCEYCFIHDSFGMACGMEYPATYHDILREEEGEWEE